MEVKTGQLTWLGKNFSDGARDIGIARFKHKPELVATLTRDDGSEAMHELLLGEKIENVDGMFVVKWERVGPDVADDFWRPDLFFGV